MNFVEYAISQQHYQKQHLKTVLQANHDSIKIPFLQDNYAARLDLKQLISQDLLKPTVSTSSSFLHIF